MHLSSRVYRKLRLLLVATLVISALAAAPALARGGKRSTGGSGVCLVTPNPLNQLPYIYTVWGSGFPPGMVVNVLVENTLGTAVLLGTVGADGTFSTSSVANSKGTQQVYVRQAGDRQATDLAHCSFVVD